MKHIVIDARESGTTSGRYVDKLVEYLHKIQPDSVGYRFTLLAKPQRIEYLSALAPGFAVVACPHKEFTFDEQIGLKRQIEGLNPDLVHFTFVQQPVWYRGKVVTTMQDLTTIRFDNPAKNPLVFKAKQQVYKWVNKRVAEQSQAIITPTEFVKQDVVQYCGIKPEKVTVTLESSDDLPTPAEPVTGLEDKRYIMYLGRPTPHKNLERLIQAFALLHDEQPDLHLVLAGKKDANYQRIENDVKKQRIANIIFSGFISDQQLRWLYGHCQAYIFPSLSEGFGLPGLEAMRHGAPVVSSNATCLPEVHGNAALYFDPLNVQDMANKITTMLSDQDLRHDFITLGRVQANKFSWQRMAEQTLEVYKKVL